jgi:hypothetical protein
MRDTTNPIDTALEASTLESAGDDLVSDLVGHYVELPAVRVTAGPGTWECVLLCFGVQIPTQTQRTDETSVCTCTQIF